MDRRLLLTVASGLAVLFIGGCGGSPTAEPPVERQSLIEGLEDNYSIEVEAHRLAPVELDPRPAKIEGALGAPDPESTGPGIPVPSPDAPPPDRQGSPKQAYESATPKSANRRASGSAQVSGAMLRTYFARRFLYKDWYPHVREVVVGNGVASISAWHLSENEARAAAGKICDAALSSHRLRKARVRFDSGSVSCVALPEEASR